MIKFQKWREGCQLPVVKEQGEEGGIHVTRSCVSSPCYVHILAVISHFDSSETIRDTWYLQVFLQVEVNLHLPQNKKVNFNLKEINTHFLMYDLIASYYFIILGEVLRFASAQSCLCVWQDFFFFHCFIHSEVFYSLKMTSSKLSCLDDFHAVFPQATQVKLVLHSKFLFSLFDSIFWAAAGFTTHVRGWASCTSGSLTAHTPPQPWQCPMQLTTHPFCCWILGWAPTQGSCE